MKIKNQLLRGILSLFLTWALSCLIMIFAKIIFYFVHKDIINDSGFNIYDLKDIIFHGFRMDSSVAAYISIIPAILISVSLLVKTRLVKIISFVYFGVISIILSSCFVLDTALYSYWGFKLDSTPIFYFFSSPSSAMASIGAGEMSVAVLCVIFGSVCIYALYLTFLRVFPLPQPEIRGKGVYYPLIMLLFSCILILPLRGGLTVSTTNLSSAYFSDKKGLNHAAINPIFSLIYSLTEQIDFDKQFHFFERKEADLIFSKLVETNSLSNDTIVSLTNNRPDIYIIILESFSSHLFPTLGGDSIALKMDSIAKENILFTNFYASGFRTDRAIPAILSGFPAQPTTSVMKFVEKASNLPSLAKTLNKNGYVSEYYYGGDANFTSMKAYLVNGGFSKIISDQDFSIKDKLSKWGAHDDVLMRKVKEEISKDNRRKPKFRVIQTSSSHEPFDVPYKNKRFVDQPALNAFAFTDSCAADFIRYLNLNGDWENSLVIIVPDHYGVYPDQLDGLQERHHIPLILTGGALGGVKKQLDTYGSHVDIAASILSLMKISHDNFIFSNNLFSLSAPHYAYITDRNEIGLIDEKNQVTYNIDTQSFVLQDGVNISAKNKELKAYIQKIFDTLAEL